MIKAIVCDLDGSLMKPSSGLYVSERVKKLLIEVQKKGILVILNSARIFQGVYPLAKQIQMDTFGGYIISSNGAQVFDAKKNCVVFEYSICHEDVKKILSYGLQNNLDVGYSQPDYFVANNLCAPFDLDRHNCHVDYLISYDMKKYLKLNVNKCCFACEKEKMDREFSQYKKDLEKECFVKVVHSTSTMIDIVPRNCEKVSTVDRLLKILGISWNEVSAIGDGGSDADVLKYSGYGVTLENGCDACKGVADKIVPSCDEDGCIEWLEELICE